MRLQQKQSGAPSNARRWCSTAGSGLTKRTTVQPPSKCQRERTVIATARDGLNGDAKCLTGLSQSFAPIAEITQRRTLEAAIGEVTQNRHDGFRVMAVRRRDIDR